MNNPRRKRISELADKLSDIMGDLQECHYEEQEYMDNMPENLWGSERYSIAENAIDYLEEAISNLEDVISSVEAAAE